MENNQDANLANAGTGISKFAGVQLFNAIGKRTESVPEEADIIVAESTVGSFKVMPAVADKLQIKDGSFVTVQTVDLNGELYVLIGKGKDGVPELDEQGNIKLDHRQRRVWKEKGFGAIVSERSAGSNVFQFSVASAWKDLGMKEDGKVKKVYRLGESITRNDIPMPDGNFLTTVLHELVFVRDEVKPESTKKEKADTAETAEGEAQSELNADVSNPVPTSEYNGTAENQEFNEGFQESEL